MSMIIPSSRDLTSPTILSPEVVQIYNHHNKKLTVTAIENMEQHHDHFETNKKTILTAAKGLNGTAIILGCGNGNDIPLADLAQQFDKITLVDIDLEPIKKEINMLPLPLQGKIHTVQQDLTGLLPYISKKINLLSLELSEDKCVEAVNEILNKSILKDKKQNSLEKYNFVVSSMLTSQLHLLIHEYVQNFLQKRYANIQENTLNGLLVPTHKLAVHLSTKHLEDLANWTHANSRVYFADTTKFTATEVIKDDLGEFSVVPTGEPSYSPLTEMRKTITNLFTIHQNANWQWQIAIPRISLEPVFRTTNKGRLANVEAYCLLPKQS